MGREDALWALLGCQKRWLVSVRACMRPSDPFEDVDDVGDWLSSTLVAELCLSRLRFVSENTSCVRIGVCCV